MAKNALRTLVEKTRKAAPDLALLSTDKKNTLLLQMADSLIKNESIILKANAKDLKAAQSKGLSPAMLDRLTLNGKRLAGMVQAIREVVGLKDPVNEVTEEHDRNGLNIKHVRIPLGVILMIYESRPNVTVDAAVLCFKSANAVILRGGSEAFHSSHALVKIMRQVLKDNGVSPDVITMVPDTDRKSMVDLLKFDDLIDIVIPRGGEALMQFIKKHSAIPVIKHDKGVCSIFVDESADLERALTVIDNAKTQRPGVCNALETLYVHEKIAADFLPKLAQLLTNKGVELRGDARVKKILPMAKKASEADWSTEYLDLILAIKIVKNVHEAITCVRRYSSHHTDSILTASTENADLFVRSLDSSCVMVNTSTRFNDGGELGLGAEIGISTTKLHAYGPMGLRELTTRKFVVTSDYRSRGS